MNHDVKETMTICFDNSNQLLSIHRLFDTCKHFLNMGNSVLIGWIFGDQDTKNPLYHFFAFSSDDEWSSSGRGYDRVPDDRRHHDYSPGPRRGDSFRGVGFQGRRSRSRDDLQELERNSGRGGRDAYDDSFLREAMEKKKLGEQQRTRSREHLDSESERSDRNRGGNRGPPLPLAPPAGNPDRRGNFPLLPPPYTGDSDSLPSSKKTNLKKV